MPSPTHTNTAKADAGADDAAKAKKAAAKEAFKNIDWKSATIEAGKSKEKNVPQVKLVGPEGGKKGLGLIQIVGNEKSGVFTTVKGSIAFSQPIQKAIKAAGGSYINDLTKEESEKEKAAGGKGFKFGGMKFDNVKGAEVVKAVAALEGEQAKTLVKALKAVKKELDGVEW